MPKRLLSGKVVSSKNNKSIIVEVTRRVKHKLYKKIIKRIKRYHAHDEDNAYKIGDNVTIQETKPISKMKSWITYNGSSNIKERETK
jgi:small subunit ribosomal protein S17